jgi:hypothetical protein
MSTAQIVILLGLTLLAMILVLLHNYEDMKFFSLIGLFLLYCVMTFVAAIAIMEMNRFEKANKNKCPEYEKVENVYRLKE